MVKQDARTGKQTISLAVISDLPEGLVKSESSGTTLASEDDPRPSVLQIGQQLSAALSKLQ